MKSDPIQGYSANEYNILSEAQELKQDASIVLPLLNIAIHPYTQFIINKILVRKLDSIENILTELKFINTTEILELIRLSVGENFVNYKRIEDELKGIKYLNEFITYKANILDDDQYL